MFRTAPIFLSIRDSAAKIVVLQGGTSSSKTVSALQEAVVYAIYNKGKVITVIGESIPNLKKGAYRDTEWLYSISPHFQQAVEFWNKSQRIIHFKSGSIIEFISVIDEQAAKSGKRDRLIVDEANGITWLVFFQLAIRTRGKVVITYNPTAPFWSHEKLIGTTPLTNDLSATVQTFYTDHRHNPFLSQEEHDKIEGIKDQELWNVYARGKTGNLTGLIYTNWKMIPDKDFPWTAEVKFAGVDFGYTNDPTACVRMARIGESVFCHELSYTTGLTPREIKTLFTAQGFTPDDPIYCEHDPDMIRQMRLLELLAIPARKGQGSLNAGISKVHEYQVFYTESSTNIHNERQKYMWMIDPATGKSINTPKPGEDHALDCIRYGVYTHFYRQE